MSNEDEQRKQASDARQQGIFILMLTALGVVAFIFIAPALGMDLT